MATGTTVHFTPPRSIKPAFFLPGISEEQAAKTSQLLQENHDQYHIFFNQSGFHNHIAHHLCTLFALNASPETIQKQYDDNKSYQRAPAPLDRAIIEDLHDPSKYQKYLGNERYYTDYLKFFEGEIDNKGWQNVLKEYLFARDERADDMLVRLFAGFLHPIIHLGFGIEFQQPAIMAEGLAMAAVHDRWMKPLFIAAEELASKTPDAPSKTLVELLEEVRAKPQLREAAGSTNNNRIREGILAKEAQTMVDIVAQYRVRPDELNEKNAEMTNVSAYFTGAAQRPDKEVKMDFFYMHCINCSIFFNSFLAQDWLSTEDKVRLMEWKGRNDVTLYASRGSPELRLDEIRNYKPKVPSKDPEDPWQDIITRVCRFEDDGHGSKLVRALAHGQKICEPYQDRPDFPIKHADWLQLGHMTIDSVEAPDGTHWVRGTGFDSAWKKIPDRSKAQL